MVKFSHRRDRNDRKLFRLSRSNEIQRTREECHRRLETWPSLATQKPKFKMVRCSGRDTVSTQCILSNIWSFQRHSGAGVRDFQSLPSFEFDDSVFALTHVTLFDGLWRSTQA